MMPSNWWVQLLLSALLMGMLVGVGVIWFEKIVTGRDMTPKEMLVVLATTPVLLVIGFIAASGEAIAHGVRGLFRWLHRGAA